MTTTADVTKAYVDTLTNSKYATRTSDTANFDALKDMYTVYLNSTVIPENKWIHGLALLVAHHYALDDTQAPDSGGSDTAVGGVTTERVGDLTQVRGTTPYLGDVKGWKMYLMQSKYGVEFLYLLKTFKPTPLVL